MELQGTLCSGLGEGASFTQLDWVAHAFREKLGFVPHPGTVNLNLTGDAWSKARARLRQTAGIAIIPPPGFCAAKCFAVLLNERVEGFAVLPEVPDYPANKLEIVAPVFVRRELNLRDSDCVNLWIDIR
jgi:riboflavin kinase